MLVLEINDAEIVLAEDGEVRYAEPGVAFVDRDGAQFGHAALAKSRLHPRQSHNEFWQRLNADAVTPAGRGIANQADLVYRHLLAIRAAAGLKGRCEVVVAAPAAVKPADLAMLLGIADEASMTVAAIVDSALVAACQHVADACRVLDVGLHRAVVTQLETASAKSESGAGQALELRRGAFAEVPAVGFAALLEGWVDAVADRFVESARFDPLRIAETEQQVFDQVLGCIARGDSEAAIEVRHDDSSRNVQVPRQALADKSAQRYEVLLGNLQADGQAASGGTLALTERARSLPGLARALRQAGYRIEALPANAVVQATQHFEATIGAAQDGAGARLVTALPLDRGTAPAVEDAPLPTHLLCNGIAAPLHETTAAGGHPACGAPGAMFSVRLTGRTALLAPDAGADVLVNGERVDGERRVRRGDAVRCAGHEFQLVEVV